MIKQKLNKKYVKIVKLFSQIGCGSEYSRLNYCDGRSCQNHKIVKQLMKLLKIKHRWEYNKGIKEIR